MKVLMVGLGGIGQRHVRNLRHLLGDSVQLSAYRVRRLPHVLTDELIVEAQEGLEQKYGIRSFDRLDVALQERPDVAFITNPSSEHIDVALAAAEAGCHLFIEKPLAISEERLEQLVALAEAKALTTFVGYQLRFHPGLQKLAELIDTARVGTLLSVQATVGEYLPEWHPYENYRSMYAARRDLGGGVLLSQIHEFDYLYSFFGLPKRLFALGGKRSQLEIDVEDSASVLMECALRKDLVQVHVQLDFLQRPPVRTCELFGDAGRARLDFHEASVRVVDPDGTEEIQSFRDFQRNDMYIAELEHFLRCVRGEGSPLVDLRAGWASVKIALAAKRSIETGAVVHLS